MRAKVRDSSVDDPAATAPTTILGPQHREPLERSLEMCRVVATDVELPAVAAQCDAELVQQGPGLGEQAAQKATHRASGQALEPKANDPITGHIVEGRIVHLHGGEHCHIHANGFASGRANTDRVSHQYTPRGSLAQICLSEVY